MKPTRRNRDPKPPTCAANAHAASAARPKAKPGLAARTGLAARPKAKPGLAARTGLAARGDVRRWFKLTWCAPSGRRQQARGRAAPRAATQGADQQRRRSRSAPAKRRTSRRGRPRSAANVVRMSIGQEWRGRTQREGLGCQLPQRTANSRRGRSQSSAAQGSSTTGRPRLQGARLTASATQSPSSERPFRA